MDQIIVMRNGTISECGTYRQLMDHDGAFAEYLRTYMNDPDNSDYDSDEESKYEQTHVYCIYVIQYRHLILA